MVESTNGSFFLIEQDIIQTPAISEGLIDDVFRKAFIDFLRNEMEFKLIETEIPIFSIQQAQEMFLISQIYGFVKYKSIPKENLKSKYQIGCEMLF